MRIRLKSLEPAMTGDDACTLFYFGDTHDYTVNITGVENINVVSDDINFFPNPVSNIVQIKANSNIKQISVFNYLGQQIYQNKPNSLNSEIDVFEWNAGIYFITIKTTNGIYTEKLIKN